MYTVYTTEHKKARAEEKKTTSATPRETRGARGLRQRNQPPTPTPNTLDKPYQLTPHPPLTFCTPQSTI
mgnify:CR=1 FL=1